MPRQKKDDLSPAVGPVNHARKSGNPDFVSSSFYVPKKINLRFNNAINTLKAEGFEVDRSDLLSVFMDRFATAVRNAEDAGEEMDLQALLGSAVEEASGDVASVSAYKQQFRQSIEAMKAESDAGMAQVQELLKKATDLQEKAQATYGDPE